jgi:hypothetical protein
MAGEAASLGVAEIGVDRLDETLGRALELDEQALPRSPNASANLKSGGCLTNLNT